MAYVSEIEMYGRDPEFRAAADMLRLPATCDGVEYAETLRQIGATDVAAEDYTRLVRDVLTQSGAGVRVGSSIMELLDTVYVNPDSIPAEYQESFTKLASILTDTVIDVIAPVQVVAPGSTTTAA